MASTKPTMDVYYSQGAHEYGKQMARYNYEQGMRGRDIEWVDPTYGTLNYEDYLNKPQQGLLKGLYEQVEKNPTLFNAGGGGYYSQSEAGTSPNSPTSAAGQASMAEITAGKTVGGVDLSTLDPNSMVTVTSPTGETRQVTAQQAAGFKGWTVSGGTAGSGVKATERLTTPEFATQFQQRFGRTATQQELQNYVSTGTFPTNVQTIDTDKSPTRTAQNTVKGYDTNNNWAEVWVPAGKYVPGVSLYPKGMSADNLQGETIKKIPGAEAAGAPSIDFANAMVTGASTNLQEIIKMLTPQDTAADKKQQSLLDQMASMTGDLANKAADQLTAEQSAGLPQLRQQFADINAQILSRNAEYNVLLQANQNKPITMNSIIGNERAILNAKAADIGLLQARALGLQGQIETAQNTVNRAIDLKYSTMEAQLNVYQAQLNALQPTLNKEEKIQAQAQQVLIEQQRQQLEDAKTEQKNIQGVMLSAIEAGITDQSVLNKISAASSYTEAIKLYGQNAPNLGDKELVADMIGKYPDAGITSSDTLAQAQAKLSKSRIYQDQVRGPVGSGGGGTKIYTAKNIPPELKTELINNIANGANRNELYTAYADVDTAYIDSLLESVEVNEAPQASATVENEDAGSFKWWNPLTWLK